MVLQRGVPVPVWGEDNPGARVRVEFAGQAQSAVAGPDGKWKLTLDPLKTGDAGALIVTGSARIELRDVAAGEVWFLSGQSNMEFALWHCEGGEEAIAHSANPDLRLFTVDHAPEEKPQSDVRGRWVSASPASVRNFSAVGYWFGSKLQKKLGVPVGLINNSYGGTYIESWLSRQTLEAIPHRDRYTDFEAMKADQREREEKARPLQEAYDRAVAEAKAAGKPSPPAPAGLAGVFRGPSMVYNGEVYPLIPFAVRGVAWYQGESNAYVGRADTYETLLRALIRQWRSEWNAPELPFLIFQITPNRKPQTDPNEESGIAVVQEAQLHVFRATPRTSLIVTMDVAETDVHYLRKEPVGERAMHAALSLVYGDPADSLSPMAESWEVRGDTMTIAFSHAEGGLTARGGAPAGFAIAGPDGRFVFAEAAIEGNRIRVRSPEVPHPAAVRYGWADFPHVNIFNQAGLPASPFRIQGDHVQADRIQSDHGNYP